MAPGSTLRDGGVTRDATAGIPNPTPDMTTSPPGRCPCHPVDVYGGLGRCPRCRHWTLDTWGEWAACERRRCGFETLAWQTQTTLGL